eukprot:PhM_4_TR11001/c0_g1_i1/m.80633/K00861/RFK, FMN1; riboflavin kinase
MTSKLRIALFDAEAANAITTSDFTSLEFEEDGSLRMGFYAIVCTTSDSFNKALASRSENIDTIAQIFYCGDACVTVDVSTMHLITVFKSTSELLQHLKMIDNLNGVQFPLAFRGEVVPGMKRGAALLGVPTANISNLLDTAGTAQSIFNSTLLNSVLYGFCCINNNNKDAAVLPMVMSVGNNPQFQNDMPTIEVHVMAPCDDDFYGAKFAVVVLGYVRHMQAYSSLDVLKDVMQADIRFAKSMLSNLKPADTYRSML